MAYCKNCGEEIADNAYICTYCGVKVNKVSEAEDDSVTLGIVGIVFSFFIPLISWICGGIGLSRAIRFKNRTGKNTCIAAIILSTLIPLGIFIFIISIIVSAATL